MGMDIAIIGVGLFPFGRHAGVSAMEMGVTAVRRQLVADDSGRIERVGVVLGKGVGLGKSGILFLIIFDPRSPPEPVEDSMQELHPGVKGLYPF